MHCGCNFLTPTSMNPRHFRAFRKNLLEAQITHERYLSSAVRAFFYFFFRLIANWHEHETRIRRCVGESRNFTRRYIACRLPLIKVTIKYNLIAVWGKPNKAELQSSVCLLIIIMHVWRKIFLQFFFSFFLMTFNVSLRHTFMRTIATSYFSALVL